MPININNRFIIHPKKLIKNNINAINKYIMRKIIIFYEKNIQKVKNGNI